MKNIEFFNIIIIVGICTGNSYIMSIGIMLNLLEFASILYEEYMPIKFHNSDKPVFKCIPITSLEYCPQHIGGKWLGNSELTGLKGCPEKIDLI